MKPESLANSLANSRVFHSQALYFNASALRTDMGTTTNESVCATVASDEAALIPELNRSTSKRIDRPAVPRNIILISGTVMTLSPFTATITSPTASPRWPVGRSDWSLIGQYTASPFTKSKSGSRSGISSTIKPFHSGDRFKNAPRDAGSNGIGLGELYSPP